MPRSARTAPETALVRECLIVLHALGCVAWRQNAGAMPIQPAAGGARRFVRLGPAGVSDIIGALPGGRLLAVECKMPRGRLRAEQKMFIQQITAIGGLALVARSAAELVETVRKVIRERQQTSERARR